MTGIVDTLKLRALGHGSLSSVLKILVDVSWVVSCAALGFVWIITAISVFASIMGNGDHTSALARISIHGAEMGSNWSSAEKIASWTIAGTIVCLGIMQISAHLRGVFETLVDGDPFVPENASRFRRIAAILAGLELARLLVIPLISFLARLIGSQSNFDISTIFDRITQTNFITWAAVLILVVLAQVFDEGARLREDQKMTI